MIDLYDFDEKVTCSFTGHRILSNKFDYESLKFTLYDLVNKGYTTFLCGMAIGFDTVCFNMLMDIKKEYDNIKVVACIPCLNQDKYFNKKQKQEYQRIMSLADKTIVFSEEYNNSCMHIRNRFMVDNSSKIIAYLKCNYGGTYTTIKYAKSKNKDVIYIVDKEQN